MMNKHDAEWPKCPYCKETMFLTRGGSGAVEWCCGCDTPTMDSNYKKYNAIAPEPMPRLRCDKCRFWDGYMSMCRRFPPGPNFPTTEAIDWCGEWQEVIL